MTDIGISRKQRVFAALESAKGTLVFPAATDFIRPAGNAVVNQNPAFSDSEELQDTLDVLDQFEMAMPAGEFTIPTYLRPATTVGGTPQADALWTSLMGSINAATTASLDGGIATADVTLKLDGLAGGRLPEKGMITIGSETMYYGSIDRTSLTATTATLSSMVRGQNGTDAATQADNVDISLTSRFYKQATSSSSCSIWLETDHFTQGLSGCSVNQAALSITNDGPITVNFTGQGMQMVWAGTSAPTSTTTATPAATVIKVLDAKLFSVGAYIQNETLSDTNSAAGYEISVVDSTSASNSITVNSAREQVWAGGNVIKGYLPTASVIGTPVEGTHTAIEVDSVSATIKPSDLTIGAPKEYVTDEVGTDYPEAYLENVRDITAAFNLYFRAEDAKYFTDGYAGEEVPVLVTLDDSDGEHRVDVYMKKCKLTVPTVAFTAPAVELNMTLKALGTVGEDSLEVVFN